MQAEKNKGRKKILALVVIILAAGVFLFMFRSCTEKKSSLTRNISPSPKVLLKEKKIIETSEEKRSPEQEEEIKERKKKYGLTKSLDAIVKENESFRVGEELLSMQDIQDRIRLHEGDFVERPAGFTDEEFQTKEFGIYVVKPGDNIWNIHFRLIREYLEKKRGIRLPERADEPRPGGFSSGIGKVLKFSEKKVYIYNVRKKSFEKNIDLIHPNDKIIIYNMKPIFSLLDQIDLAHVDKIYFDGKTLWIPAPGAEKNP